MKKTQVVLLDDLTGTPGAKTVQFSFQGVNYQIDLSEENVQRMEADLQPWINVARRTGGRAVGGIVHPRTEGQLIRQWAKKNGIAVNPKGRVPFAIINQYREAQKNK